MLNPTDLFTQKRMHLEFNDKHVKRRQCELLLQ
jgi:hypothetical protein